MEHLAAYINTYISSNQSIQFCTFSVPSIMAEKSQTYNSRKTNLTKFMQDDFINSKNSLRTLDGEDTFITCGSAHRKNSSCSIIQNFKDEDKLSHSNLSCSLKSPNSFRKVNSPGAVDLKSAQYGKNRMEDHTEVSQNGQKPEKVLPHSLDGFDDMTYASLISLVKGSNVRTHEELAVFEDQINSRDHHTEKPITSDVHKCAGELEIGRKCFLDNIDMNEDEETYSHSNAVNKANSECTLAMDISPDNVVGAIGEQQVWKKIFVKQVFELHRLIKVQRLIAGSPHVLLEDNLLLNKPPPKTSTTKKFQSDFASQKPSAVVKLDNKSVKVNTVEKTTNSVVGKIPIPCISNTTKGNLALASADSNSNSKQSPSYVYPQPGNQWLVPVMSPFEGLEYKPIIWPCPANASFMAPING
ncbi:Protein HEADING DATE 3B [Glycine soja]